SLRSCLTRAGLTIRRSRGRLFLLEDSLRVQIEREYYADGFKITSKKGSGYIRAGEIPSPAVQLLDSVCEVPKKQRRALKMVRRVQKREERLRAKIEKGRAKLERKRARL
ncbi:MAG: hypothetical protein PHU49_16130, partial [Syntrophorhabdaceae bacterium]|nr:hypothetical protein [Syntrophorhabdaceae bacterium]